MWALASSKLILVLFVIDKRFTEAVNDTKGDSGFELTYKTASYVVLFIFFLSISTLVTDNNRFFSGDVFQKLVFTMNSFNME